MTLLTILNFESNSKLETKRVYEAKKISRIFGNELKEYTVDIFPDFFSEKQLRLKKNKHIQDIYEKELYNIFCPRITASIETLQIKTIKKEFKFVFTTLNNIIAQVNKSYLYLRNKKLPSTTSFEKLKIIENISVNCLTKYNKILQKIIKNEHFLK